LVSSDIIALLEDLRRIRNVAVHDEEPKITKGQALEFLSIASRIEEALKSARERISTSPMNTKDIQNE
jgi:hypothetical protein